MATHYERYGKAYKDKQREMGLCTDGCGQPRHWSSKNLCIRHAASKTKHESHGVGFDARMVMYENQGGACLICGEYEPNPIALHVDHDHDTQEIRGLLCTKCNPGLGYFRDNPRLLRKAAEYLEKGA